jgi:hypothetical protein
MVCAKSGIAGIVARKPDIRVGSVEGAAALAGALDLPGVEGDPLAGVLDVDAVETGLLQIAAHAARLFRGLDALHSRQRPLGRVLDG